MDVEHLQHLQENHRKLSHLALYNRTFSVVQQLDVSCAATEAEIPITDFSITSEAAAL